MKAGETAAASKKAYTYDRNGNQISQSDSVTGESAALTYDAAGRLSKYEAKKDNAVVVTQDMYRGDQLEFHPYDHKRGVRCFELCQRQFRSNG